MIRKILNKLSLSLYKTEDHTKNCMKYAELRKHPGWKVHQLFLTTIANEMASSLLSKDFTDLDKETKDANQRAFYITKEIIDFLFDPLKGTKQYAKIALHNQKLEATYPNRKEGN